MTNQETVHGLVRDFPEEERASSSASRSCRSHRSRSSWTAPGGPSSASTTVSWNGDGRDTSSTRSAPWRACSERPSNDSAPRVAGSRRKPGTSGSSAEPRRHLHGVPSRRGRTVHLRQPSDRGAPRLPPEVAPDDRTWWWATVHPDDARAQVANRLAFATRVDFDQIYRMENGRRALGVGARQGPPGPRRGRTYRVLAGLHGGRERADGDGGTPACRPRLDTARWWSCIPAVTYTDSVGADGVT